jgi:hypothetical protein
MVDRDRRRPSRWLIAFLYLAAAGFVLSLIYAVSSGRYIALDGQQPSNEAGTVLGIDDEAAGTPADPEGKSQDAHYVTQTMHDEESPEISESGNYYGGYESRYEYLKMAAERTNSMQERRRRHRGSNQSRHDAQGVPRAEPSRVEATIAPTSTQLRSEFGALDGKARIIADDGTYLGLVSSNRFDSDSIINRFGDYGSRYSRTSIFNGVGRYGGTLSSTSPWNKMASRPPKVFVGERFVGYLSANKFKTTRIDPHALLAYLYAPQSSESVLTLCSAIHNRRVVICVYGGYNRIRWL